MSVENSNVTIRNRTHDPPACSAVPKPNDPRRASSYLLYEYKIIWNWTIISLWFILPPYQYLRLRSAEWELERIWKEAKLADHIYYLDIYVKGLSSPNISLVMADVSKDFGLHCIPNVANRALSIYLPGETEESEHKPQNGWCFERDSNTLYSG
jgi:hypothetical protein